MPQVLERDKDIDAVIVKELLHNNNELGKVTCHITLFGGLTKEAVGKSKEEAYTLAYEKVKLVKGYVERQLATIEKLKERGSYLAEFTRERVERGFE